MGYWRSNGHPASLNQTSNEYIFRCYRPLPLTYPNRQKNAAQTEGSPDNTRVNRGGDDLYAAEYTAEI